MSPHERRLRRGWISQKPIEHQKGRWRMEEVIAHQLCGREPLDLRRTKLARLPPAAERGPDRWRTTSQVQSRDLGAGGRITELGDQPRSYHRWIKAPDLGISGFH
jgi:hypothetical protein